MKAIRIEGRNHPKRVAGKRLSPEGHREVHTILIPRKVILLKMIQLSEDFIRRIPEGSAKKKKKRDIKNDLEKMLKKALREGIWPYCCYVSSKEHALHACQNFCIFMKHLHLYSVPCIFISASTSSCLLSQS